MISLTSQTVVEGTLEQIVFQSERDSWCVLKLQPESTDRRPLTVTGTFARLVPGEVLRITGRWSEHPRYGPTFKASSYQQVSPATVVGIRKYLATGVKGIGEITARKLTDHFGTSTLDILDQDPQRILDVPGITQGRAKKIAKAWKGHSAMREILVFLQGYGVSSGYAHKIHRLYKERTVDMVQENPYRLATDVRGIGFKKADAIAMHLGHEKDSPFRAEAAVAYMMGESSSEGHTYTPREELLRLVARELGVARKICDDAIDRLAGDGRVLLENDRVYLPHLFRAEYEIAAQLRDLTDSPGLQDPRLDRLLTDIEAEVGVELEGEQRQAILSVFENRLVIITGGPGTGKTTLLKVLLRLFDRLGLQVLCSSPTGRAAKRMTEATGYEACTIHRLLQYQPRTREFFRNQDNPLQSDLLVIDEASMLDTELLCHLVKALPTDACFVLVGDVDQLPSVGPGNVLRDLIASGLFSVVRLLKIFRQAEQSLIVTNAHRINSGQMPVAPPNGGPLRDFFVSPARTPERALALVKSIVSERIPKVFQFDPIRDVQVLAPMYSGVVGVDSLNQELQQLLNPEGDSLKHGKFNFRTGDKVMQIVNDYDKSVFNGDIGFIDEVDKESANLVVDVGGRRIPYSRKELEALTLAYAVSVHKSQGSEYPVVLFVLMNQHFVMLRRNLLYTGLTRARKLAVVVGQSAAIQRAVERNPSARRYTSLAERLQAAVKLSTPSPNGEKST